MSFYKYIAVSFFSIASFSSACMQQNQNLSQNQFWVRMTSFFLPQNKVPQTIYCLPKQAKKRRKFTPEEDAKIVNLFNQLGKYHWPEIAQQIPGRTTRQCRERYRHYLDPKLKKEGWTPEEDSIIVNLYRQMGSKWASMCQFLPGRASQDIHNRFNNHINNHGKRSMKKNNFQKIQYNETLPLIQQIQNANFNSENESLKTENLSEKPQEEFFLLNNKQNSNPDNNTDNKENNDFLNNNFEPFDFNIASPNDENNFPLFDNFSWEF